MPFGQAGPGPAAPEPVGPAPEAIERAIVELAAGMKVLGASRLKRDTIVMLLSAASGVGRRDTGTVLNALETLEQRYLKPKAK